MAPTVSNGNDRSEKWQRPFTKGKLGNLRSTTATVADVLHNTSNLIISRCCFADDGKEMDKNEKRTCRASKAIVCAH